MPSGLTAERAAELRWRPGVCRANLTTRVGGDREHFARPHVKAVGFAPAAVAGPGHVERDDHVVG